MNSETTELMAIATTSIVEGGKISSTNSAREVLAPTLHQLRFTWKTALSFFAYEQMYQEISESKGM